MDTSVKEKTTAQAVKILGIDLGVASIGWSLIEQYEDNGSKNGSKNGKILNGGVRIFTQPTDRSGNLLSAQRREARGSRRVLNRKKVRLNTLKRLLIKKELISKKELNNLFSKFDVWKLRYEGLRRELNSLEWARVLLHIAKHRGYKSNRKSEEVKDSEGKKILQSIKKNKEEMEKKKYKTVGEMVYAETKDRPSDKRVRRNKGENYNFSVSRELLEEEIDILFKKQEEFTNPFTEKEFQKQYKEIAFSQKPLQFNASMVGKCTFEEDEPRAPKRAYTSEEFVLLGKILNTDLVDTEDNTEIRFCEYNEIEDILAVFKEVKQPSYNTLRKKLNISKGLRFKQIDYYQNQEVLTHINKDSKEFFKKENWLNEEQKAKILEKVGVEKKDGKLESNTKGNIKLKSWQYSWIRNTLGLKDKDRFNGVKYDANPEEKKFEVSVSLRGYHDIKNKLSELGIFEELFKDRDRFDEIATILSYTKDDKETSKELSEKVFCHFDFDEAIVSKAINELLSLSFSDFLQISLKAAKKLNKELYKGYKYHDAAKVVYGHHSKLDPREKKDFLRPLNEDENYKITNPTVKRVLSQFRLLINAILREYGKFDAMHIELARELKHSKKQRIEIAKGQEAYRDDKEQAIEHFRELFNCEPSGKEITKFRLLKEQHHKSIYSGKPIEPERLLEQGYVEIDHILPYSRSFDDSLNNKGLCLSSENQEKGNKTPFEWLGKSDVNSNEWHEFQERVKALKIKKAKQNKLFNTTLPKRHGDELSEEDTEGEGFMARNLIDTAYASRFLKNFVEKNLLFRDNPNIKQKVKVRSGTLTSNLRHVWAIGQKDRNTNLHHAEDAIIIAFATQSAVQKLSTEAAKREKYKEVRFTPPFEGFREAVKESVDKIFVSFAPRRKISGAAHKETIKSKKKEAKEDNKFLVNKGFAEKGEVKRVDVFSNGKGEYKFVLLYPSDFYEDEFPNIDIKGEKIDPSFNFCFSLFKDELIEIKKKKEAKSRLVYFKFIKTDGTIQIQEHFQSKVGHENKGFNKKVNQESIKNIKHIEVYRKNNIKKNIEVYQKKTSYLFVPIYTNHMATEDITGEKLDNDFSKFKLLGELDKDKNLVIKEDIEGQGKVYTFKLTEKSIKLSDKSGGSSVSKASDVLVSLNTLEHIKKYQIDILGKYKEVKKEKRLPLVKEMRRIKTRRIKRKIAKKKS